MMIFWCVLANGNHNSVSATNTFEAQRRARTLDAKKLFCKNFATGNTAEIQL